MHPGFQVCKALLDYALCILLFLETGDHFEVLKVCKPLLLQLCLLLLHSSLEAWLDTLGFVWLF